MYLYGWVHKYDGYDTCIIPSHYSSLRRWYAIARIAHLKKEYGKLVVVGQVVHRMQKKARPRGFVVCGFVVHVHASGSN
jgi:hypothetical protein